MPSKRSRRYFVCRPLRWLQCCRRSRRAASTSPDRRSRTEETSRQAVYTACQVRRAIVGGSGLGRRRHRSGGSECRRGGGGGTTSTYGGSRPGPTEGRRGRRACVRAILEQGPCQPPSCSRERQIKPAAVSVGAGASP